MSCYVLSRLRVDLAMGKFYWIDPSRYHRNLIGMEAGTSRSDGGNGKKRYWVIKMDGKGYKRGRLIYLVVNGVFPAPCIDHINGDSLDDRPVNLRQATVLQNAWNHKSRKKSSNLPMGVRQQHGKFTARISCEKNHLYLGSFGTAEEAEEVYILKRKELYGEYSGY